MSKNILAAACAAALLSLSVPALAHVTLEQGQAAAGSTYRAVLRVPHGCAGSTITSIRVKIPDGMIGVKPMPKAGWQLTITKGKLATPLSDGHGGQITEGVTEIAWTGGKQPDDYYDEFVMRGGLPDKPNTVVYFPTVIECEKGVDRWIEIPASGQSSHDLKYPSPALRLTPKP